jgi:hypothetical protein
LHLHFNKQRQFSSQEARRNGEAFYSSTENRWPDYKIDFYRRLPNIKHQYSGHSMVLDAKLSKLSNLFNIHYPIKPFSQLHNYFHIHYCGTGEERPIARTIVDRVYCLYAGYGEIGNPRKDTDTVSFIRLCPVPDNDEVCGQAELQSAVLSWLCDDVRYNISTQAVAAVTPSQLQVAERGGMHQPGRPRLPLGLPYRLRLDPDGADIHDSRSIGGDSSGFCAS